MSAQPAHLRVPGEPRVPRTVDGIAAALHGRRMEFCRELGQVPLGRAEAVLCRWWCEGMLDIDPGADRIREAALEGALAIVALADVLDRQEAGGAAPVC
ncbi:hypothetical protein [Streptosporangium sandarakinum]